MMYITYKHTDLSREMIEELEKERDYLLRGHKAIFNQHPSKRALQKHIKKLWEHIEKDNLK